ncbi:hypothetical protein [Gilliamella sp. wkB112]|uniref:hypothetical protein n=1 Tax=Gilliamella sp. wkB112 TaxID=3120257 RepID=UPI00080E0BF3|nr:hypothetical protein [Gilliamella apicola]OCG00388.1 hypothetical protein A9G12_04685 [Gilliamella apicola]
MNDLLRYILAFGVVLVILLFLSFMLVIVGRLKSKTLIRQINAGKISDAKLIRLYNQCKKWKDSKFAAILSSGIFYKQWMKIQNDIFAAYEQGMIKRNLPL